MKHISLLLLGMLLNAALVCGQTAKVNNFRLEHNVMDNGRPMLKASYMMEVHGLQGHTLIPVLFVDREPGVPHFFTNNTQMKMDGPEYYASYPDTYWNGDGQFIGIYNDHLNPLPGKHTYNVRMFVFDKTEGHFINGSNSPFITYDMTGAAQAQGFTPGASGLLIDNSYILDANGNKMFLGTGTTVNQSASPSYDRHKAKCGGCNGSGDCSHCNGTGWVNNYKSKCSLCKGAGKCVSCHGRGFIRGNF